jgi:putative PIN family toxin of toxin-antitoxin system
MKVVLDTNVLIDAFRDEYSYPKRIIDEIIHGRISAYANDQTLRENRFILNKLITDDSYKNEMETLFEQIIPVENHRRIRVVEDRDDNKILESAVQAGAEYLISEDNHLFKIGNFHGVRILEPIAFWKMYEEESDDNPWQKWVKFVSGN